MAKPATATTKALATVKETRHAENMVAACWNRTATAWNSPSPSPARRRPTRRGCIATANRCRPPPAASRSAWSALATCARTTYWCRRRMAACWRRPWSANRIPSMSKYWPRSKAHRCAGPTTATKAAPPSARGSPGNPASASRLCRPAPSPTNTRCRACSRRWRVASPTSPRASRVRSAASPSMPVTVFGPGRHWRRWKAISA